MPTVNGYLERLAANPIVDITTLKAVRFVMKDGRFLRPNDYALLRVCPALKRFYKGGFGGLQSCTNFDVHHAIGCS